jgi:hypothetical protein
LDTKNLPVIICYPPGSGGSMLGSVLDSVLNFGSFEISTNGNCHNNSAGKLPHFVPGSDLLSFRNELNLIELMSPQTHNVISGHLRNLVAAQSVCYKFWFIKIVFDADNPNEINFLHQMLINKLDIKQRLKNCYSQIRFDDWPESFDKFLSQDNCEQLFREQNVYTLKNWFWIESPLTKQRTIELTLRDIFLGVPGEKLSQWYDEHTVNKMFPMIKEWQTKNHQLYPDLMALL